tara:strand:+ start:19562 stop:20107 length:546 start_codon:yes stop_codon:yes gene_type:complete
MSSKNSIRFDTLQEAVDTIGELETEKCKENQIKITKDAPFSHYSLTNEYNLFGTYSSFTDNEINNITNLYTSGETISESDYETNSDYYVSEDGYICESEKDSESDLDLNNSDSDQDINSESKSKTKSESRSESRSETKSESRSEDEVNEEIYETISNSSFEDTEPGKYSYKYENNRICSLM